MAISDEWWRGWWEADYSWDGLARMPWDGWVRPADGGPCRRKEDGVEGEPATLQDHFRDWLGGEPELFESPDGSVRFTRLHLPLAWRDGTPTGKVEWAADDRDRLMAMVRRLNDTALAQEPPSPARLDGCVLLRFDVRDLGQPADPREDDRTPVALSLERAAFSGNATLNGAAFLGNASFDRTAFSGSASFDSATFSRVASFERAIFSGVTNFANAVFSEIAYFEKAGFLGSTYFESAAFSVYAWFRSAAFSRGANFDDAAFTGIALFERAAFSGLTSFYRVIFSGHAGFQSAVFSGDTSFDHAVFSGEANFSSAAFSGGANFDSAAFSGFTSLFRAAFFSYLYFPGVSEPTHSREERQVVRAADGSGGNSFEIITPASLLPRARSSFHALVFSRGAVLGDADFSNRDVLTGADFQSTVFWGRAQFHGSRLHQGVLLDHRQFETVLADEQSTEREDLYPAALRESVCAGAARLIDGWRRTRPSQDTQTPEWSEVRAGIAAGRLGLVVRAGAPRSGPLPEDIGEIAKALEAEWPAIFAALEADRLNSRPPKGDERDLWLRNVEADFRTLKLAMEDKRERISEGEFFRLELEARRRRSDIPSWERWASWAYKVLANYGNSLRRPFVALLYLWLGFGALFLGLGAGLDRLAPIVTTSHAQISADCQRMIVENQIGAGASTALSEACAVSLGPEGAAKASLATPAVRASGNLVWAWLEDTASAYTFAWNNIFRPLSALSAEGVAPYEPSWASAVLYGYGPGWGLLVRFLATLQSLIAIVIVFLLALAIRRRFQIS